MASHSIIQLAVLVLLVTPCIMAGRRTIHSQSYVLDSVNNCGQPGDPTTQQVYIPRFSVNVTLDTGVWGVRPVSGSFTYEKGVPWWAYVARLTPATCAVVPNSGQTSWCLSGFATNVIGSPQTWNTSAEAFQAASLTELMLVVPEPTLYYLWIQDSYCPDNVGVLKLVFVQYK